MSFWSKLLAQPDYKEEASDGPRYASFSDRLFASALDTGLLFLLLTPVFQLAGDWVFGDVSLQQILYEAGQQATSEEATQYISDSGIVELMMQNFLIQYVIAGVVMVAFWVAFNTTPGKFLIGMKIVDVDTGETPNVMQYFIRYAGFVLSLPLFFIGFIWVIWAKRRQAWHDKMADTAVIYTRKRLTDWFADRHFARQKRREEAAAQKAEEEETPSS